MQKRLFTLSADAFLTILFCAVCMTVFGCDEVSDIVLSEAILSEAITDYELLEQRVKWQERYQDVDDWAVMRPPEDLSQPSVRLIYFLPNDRSVRPDRAVALCQMITDVQEFYADEMQRHGFGRKTFPVETDADDVPVVHYIEGQFEEDHYNRSGSAIGQCKKYFDDPRHIYFIAIDLSYEHLRDGRACGFAAIFANQQVNPDDAARRKYRTELFEGSGGGFVFMPVSGSCFLDDVSTENHEWRTPIHELGHAFGLCHDYRGGANNNAAVGGSGHQLTRCDAAWLSVSRLFNGEPFSVGSPGDINLLSVPTHTPEGVILRFQLADPDGLHYAQLLAHEGEDGFGPCEILACKPLNGLTDTVEFTSSALTQKSLDEILFQIIDVTGGITFASIFTDE